MKYDKDLDEILANWEHEVTGTPKHWESSEERQAIDAKYRDQLNRHYYQKFMEMLPEKQEIVTLTEPPQGIDRLWLEGRDCGVTAGYNSAISDMEAKLKLIGGEDE